MIARVVAPAGFVALAIVTTPAFAADVNYTCSEGTRLTAMFSAPGASPGNVVLVIAGANAKVTLPQVKSADGGRYANDEMEFWIRGKDATLTRAGRTSVALEGFEALVVEIAKRWAHYFVKPKGFDVKSN